MGPKKGKKGKEKKGKKAKEGEGKEADGSKENEAERQALIKDAKRLAEKAKKEEEAFNEFQQQREKINYFWIVEKKNLEDKKAELRNKERERQDLEEKHQVEIKVYKQRVKHLLYEHQNEITTLKTESETSLKLGQDDHRTTERELKTDKRSLKLDLKEMELSHEDYLKTLKQEQDKRITILRQEFERHAKELQQKFERKRKLFRDELESTRRPYCAAHDVAREGVWRDQNYYNDITHNNLDLIKSLKEEVAEMKKKEATDEKLMFEISQENKRMSEPLKKALLDVERLRQNIKSYDNDKIALKQAKAELLVLEDDLATISWEHEVLTQRYAQVKKEYDALHAQFQASIYDVQQKNGLKNLLLEKKLESMGDVLEQKDAQLNEVLAHAQLDPSVAGQVKRRLEDIMEAKNQEVRDLEKELGIVLRLLHDFTQAARAKLAEYGTPLDELGFDPNDHAQLAKAATTTHLPPIKREKPSNERPRMLAHVNVGK
ncbi:hypothetical protein SPRG_12463 [Saprolegnia parasitica CBS 223.65]|uniref:Growth arrest-specific protein 8 domain-containing protein n=1 Tax=Saprolegnia parasitica (strain CBS 223.65) TaxID=695850 RepID=A0A067BSI8_SAPPC|nr:hypothetical protein SPRG_12463 [Saprolegnia parasitica CBS 223.65]KDO21499.1 hypothetical protein SPRG_12463 [Saprolegnia parasitica CBS 223.65]|eukprot:XP_012207766.1 hypothetical protein SPRG_12463 [Saprolegnia parasitica CBS 223.65]